TTLHRPGGAGDWPGPARVEGAGGPTARRTGQSYPSNQYEERNGATVLRPGPAADLRVQPQGGLARVQRSNPARPRIRDGILGPGLGVGPQPEPGDAGSVGPGGMERDSGSATVESKCVAEG